MVLPLPPHTDDKDLDFWTQAVTEALVEGTGASTASVTTGTDNQGRPTVGTVTLGYQNRYLQTRYATSSDGSENFTNDYTSINTMTTVYQGLRSSDSSLESNNPADYTWRELSVSSGWIPQYRLIGGRQIDWMFLTSQVTDFVIDGTGSAIDLEGFTAGEQGPAGEDSFEIVVELRMRPMSVPASSIGASTTIDPGDWNFASDGDVFRNNQGEEKTLVAFARSGREAVSLAAHQAGTYSWTRAGVVFSPSVTGASRNSRWLPITAMDVQDDGSDQFVCEVTIPDNQL